MSVSIISGASSDLLTIDPTSKATRVTQYKSDGSLLVAESNQYMVTGGTSAIIAATLAANTTLASLRNGASKEVHITRLRVSFTPATVGTSALVAGSIAWQKFTTATPTGGTARTVAKKKTGYASSTVSDVRDSNAALTVTSVVFADVFSQSLVPLMTIGGLFIWANDLDDNDHIVLEANEGICLRTQVVCPATQTWMFSYAIEWHEV
jgi:phage tail protein X